MDVALPGRRTLFGVPLSTVTWFVMFLVALDCWMTVRVVEAQVGRELNPVVDWLLESHGVRAFVLAKVLLSGLCMLWVNRRAPAAEGRMAALVALSIYVPLAGLHVANSQQLVTSWV